MKLKVSSGRIDSQSAVKPQMSEKRIVIFRSVEAPSRSWEMSWTPRSSRSRSGTKRAAAASSSPGGTGGAGPCPAAPSLLAIVSKA